MQLRLARGPKLCEKQVFTVQTVRLTTLIEEEEYSGSRARLESWLISVASGRKILASE